MMAAQIYIGVIPGCALFGRRPGIQHYYTALDSGFAPSKSAVADLDNDIAELG
jgi:hypothetical protein